MVGTNRKYKVKKETKTKNGREVTPLTLMLFLMSAFLSSIN
jgi:hypothetical protein